MKTEVELRGLNDGGRVVVLGAVVSQGLRTREALPASLGGWPAGAG